MATDEINGMASLNLKGCMVIEDDFQGYPKDLFMIPKHYEESVDRVLIPGGLIQDRIEKLAKDIYEHYLKNYDGETVLGLCVLKGGYRFFTDLLNKISELNKGNTDGKTLQFSIEFIRVKSYHNDESTGEVKIIGMENLESSIRGKNILIVEDIIDTGRTMVKLLNTLQKFEPKSVTVACLVRKRTKLSNNYAPHYVAFEVPDRFIIGYALDFNEYFRDMSHICYISQAGIDKYKLNS